MGNAPAYRKRRKNRTLLAVCAVAALLGACHAHRDAGGEAPVVGIDPCTLVTRADAERLLGTRVNPPIHRETVLMATGYQCRYVAASSTGTDGSGSGIAITVYDDAHIRVQDTLFKSAADYFRRDMHALRASGTKLVPVSGLGTAAYWQPGEDLLHVLDRGVYVMLDMDGHFPFSPAPGESSDSQHEAARRAADIELVRTAILPRLATPSSLSTHSPHGGTRGPSS